MNRKMNIRKLDIWKLTVVRRTINLGKICSREQVEIEKDDNDDDDDTIVHLLLCNFL
jgi:hypothetical protein